LDKKIEAPELLDMSSIILILDYERKKKFQKWPLDGASGEFARLTQSHHQDVVNWDQSDSINLLHLISILRLSDGPIDMLFLPNESSNLLLRDDSQFTNNLAANLEFRVVKGSSA
jgi:hypothetical protein